jgi:hypothetical protein
MLRINSATKNLLVSFEEGQKHKADPSLRSG